MNQMERLLNDEVNRLMDRLAASVPDDCLGALGPKGPTLKRRLDEAEAHLAAVRATLMDDYGRWRRVLEDVENLWALASWRSASDDAAVEATTLAA